MRADHLPYPPDFKNSLLKEPLNQEYPDRKMPGPAIQSLLQQETFSRHAISVQPDRLIARVVTVVKSHPGQG